MTKVKAWKAAGAATLSRRVIDAPFSPFTEQLRSIKTALDNSLSPHDKVLGITSTIRGEGKTTIAANLARMYAAEGCRTILIQIDLGGEASTSSFEIEGSSAFISRMADGDAQEDGWSERVGRLPLDWATLTRRTRERGRISEDLEVVTADDLRRVVNAASRYELAAALGACIANARSHFDLIICDMPSLEGTAEAEFVASRHIDKIVLVLGDYRAVTLDRLSSAVFRNRFHRFPMLGVIFNKYRFA